MIGPGFGFGAAGGSRRHSAAAGAPPPPPAYTATFTMEQLPEYEELRVYQRGTTTGGGEGKGRGTIRLSLGSDATAGTIGARIRDADGGTIVQDEWLAGTIDADDTFVDVTGVDARLGWFFIDLKGVDGVWQLGTVKVGMGALYGFAGQSLTVRMLGRQDGQSASYATLGIAPNPNSAVLATYHDANSYAPTVASMPWKTPGDVGNGQGPNAVGVGAFLNHMIALTGVNCGVVGYGVTGANSASFHQGQDNWTGLSAVLARVKSFEGFVWGQGHTDAKYGIPPKVYGQALTAIFGQITAANSFADYGKYVWTIPSSGLGSSWGTPSQASRIRQGAQDWCAANDATYIHMDDTNLVDGVHQSQAGSLTMGRHIYRAMRARYGASDGAGPTPISATRSGQTITLTLSDEGQTALSLAGEPGKRIFVFPRGRVNPMGTNATDNRFPVSAVSAVNATTLAITLANDPGAGHELDLWFYWPSGPTNSATDNIYDNRTDGDGITNGRIVQASLAPIRIAAPVPAGAINAPPSGFIAAVSPFSMVETGTAYADSDGGAAFGKQMTAGKGKASNTPLFLPVTVEGFVTCPSLPSAVIVMFGGFGSYGSYFVAMEASGRIRAWDFGVTSSTYLVPGKRYHIACQCGPGGLALYVTNVTDGGAGTREYLSAYSGSLRPGVGNFQLRNHNNEYQMSGGALDEWAVFNSERYSGATYACPTTPFTGAEADIVALYRCDGNAKDVVAA